VAASAFAAPQRVERPAIQTGDALGPNDTCETAFDLAGAFGFDTDTCDDADDYDLLAGNTCTGYSSSGADEVYKICLPPGGTVDLTFEELQYDASIYLVTDCNDLPASCVVGDDCYPNPCTDYISYVNPNPENTVYYLIVDGFGGACGIGHLEGMADACDVTPVEPTTWGHIKGLHR
jgi:hypothetical protein